MLATNECLIRGLAHGPNPKKKSDLLTFIYRKEDFSTFKISFTIIIAGVTAHLPILYNISEQENMKI